MMHMQAESQAVQLTFADDNANPVMPHLAAE